MLYYDGQYSDMSLAIRLYLLACLQSFDTVGWASGRLLSDEVLVWLSAGARCRLFALDLSTVCDVYVPVAVLLSFRCI